MYNRSWMERETTVSQTPAQKEIPHYEGDFIPLNKINVLNQPRQTFRDIDFLAQDLARKNILNPLTVAELDAEQAKEYVETINAIWETDHKLEELVTVPNGEEEDKYYILIAGERRLRALKTLAIDGCFDCQENYGRGSCTSNHPRLFKDGGKVEVRLMRNFDALTAIDTQASENTHMRPPPEEEAHFYDKYYKLKRRIDPKYKISQFARDVGKSPDTINAALKFCRLPQEIQKYAEDGTISYGIAVELQRAREALELNEIDLKYWLLKAITERYSVADFRKRISSEIDMKNIQQDKLGFFTGTEEEDMDRKYRKKVVAQNMVLGMWDFIKYFRTVKQLLESGDLGLKDSPFSIRSPLRLFRNLVEEQKSLLPHLENILSELEIENITNVLNNAEELIITLQARKVDELQIFPELSN